jgi:hypothetical protein
LKFTSLVSVLQRPTLTASVTHSSPCKTHSEQSAACWYCPVHTQFQPQSTNSKFTLIVVLSISATFRLRLCVFRSFIWAHSLSSSCAANPNVIAKPCTILKLSQPSSIALWYLLAPVMRTIQHKLTGHHPLYQLRWI